MWSIWFSGLDIDFKDKTISIGLLSIILIFYYLLLTILSLLFFISSGFSVECYIILCFFFFLILCKLSIILLCMVITLHSENVSVSSVIQSCPTPCDPMNHSMPGVLVHQQLPESTQTPVHRVGDAIQPSHPLSSPSPPALNPCQQQGLFQWVNSSHEVAKVLQFQL